MEIKTNVDNMVACEACGTPHAGSYGSGRFCGVSCARRYATASRRAEISRRVSRTLTRRKAIPCGSCGLHFMPRRKSTRFCSRSCAMVSRMNAPGVARDLGQRSAKSQGDRRRSQGEIELASLLSERFNVLTNARIFDGFDADIVLPDQRIAVHWDGPWHRRKICEGHSVKQVQTRDRLKRRIARRLGYRNITIRAEGKYNRSDVLRAFESVLRVANRATVATCQ